MGTICSIANEQHPDSQHCQLQKNIIYCPQPFSFEKSRLKTFYCACQKCQSRWSDVIKNRELSMIFSHNTEQGKMQYNYCLPIITSTTIYYYYNKQEACVKLSRSTKQRNLKYPPALNFKKIVRSERWNNKFT